MTEPESPLQRRNAELRWYQCRFSTLLAVAILFAAGRGFIIGDPMVSRLGRNPLGVTRRKSGSNRKLLDMGRAQPGRFDIPQRGLNDLHHLSMHHDIELNPECTNVSDADLEQLATVSSPALPRTFQLQSHRARGAETQAGITELPDLTESCQQRRAAKSGCAGSTALTAVLTVGCTEYKSRGFARARACSRSRKHIPFPRLHLDGIVVREPLPGWGTLQAPSG